MSESKAFARTLLGLATILLVTVTLGAVSGGLTPPAHVAQAQSNGTVTITAQTVDAPGGCLITVDGGTGTAAGFTGYFLGEYRPANFFEQEFEGGATLYTTRWGMIEMGQMIVFVYCEKNISQNNMIIYFHNAQITYAEGVLDGELVAFDVNWSPAGPTTTPPAEFGLEGKESWYYVGSSRSEPKSFTLTVLPD